jgi:hypothetical protein
MKNKLTLSLIVFGLITVSFGSIGAEKKHSPTKKLAEPIQYTTSEPSLNDLQHDEITKLLIATRYAHGLAVVNSPFLGQRDVYDVNDLIVNLPTMNLDLNLLEQRQRLDNYAIQHHEVLPDRPLIDLSGAIETQAFYDDNFCVNNSCTSNTDIDLSRVELDVVAEVGTWATGALLLSYENAAPLITSSPTPGSRVTNSRIKIDRAFITIGNLSRSPIYFTMGQMYVPFGMYATGMISDPLTKLLGRTKERMAQLAFSKYGIYGAVYGAHGDSFVDNKNTIDLWGANLGYKTSFMEGFNTEFGVGYINNLADSVGLQTSIFGMHPGYEQLQHRVPAVNAHASLNLNPFTLLAEYIGAVQSFDIKDMSFNNSGALPQAVAFEGIYRFNISDQAFSLALGYDRTWESLAARFPEQSFLGTLSTSFWRYTIESLEYRHSINYSHSDIASFGSTQKNNFQMVTVLPQNSRNENVITLQIGVYF